MTSLPCYCVLFAPCPLDGSSIGGRVASSGIGVRFSSYITLDLPSWSLALVMLLPNLYCAPGRI